MGIVVVFGSSTTELGTDQYQNAFRLGSLLATASWAVATGGYGGTMEAVSAGAAAVGGHVIGVTAPTVFPMRGGPNSHVREEVRAGTISERIHLLVDMADAVVALPGSIGTVTELLVAWNDNFVAQFSDRTGRLLVTVGEPLERLVGYLATHFGADAGLVQCVSTVDEAAAALGTSSRTDSPQ